MELRSEAGQRFYKRVASSEALVDLNFRSIMFTH